MEDTPDEKFAWAVKNGSIPDVDAMLEKSPGLASKPIEGCLPVCQAADYGQEEVLSRLIEKGADVNVSDKYGITPLLAAIWEGHTNCVKLLICKGAKKTGSSPDGMSYIDCAEKDEIKRLLS